MDSSWSLGVLVGGPVAAALILICLAVIAISVISERRDPYADGGWYVFAGMAGVVLLIVGVLTALAFYPYRTAYHRWEPTTGTIAQISARLLSTDGNVTQRFVVRFTDGRERSCDDTRCSLLAVGDVLHLKCKRHWQFSGTDGWDCNYVGRGAQS